MLDATPLLLADGWSVASLEAAHFDAQAISDLTRWIEETYEYQNAHAVLIEHDGNLVYELYLRGQDQRWGRPLGDRVFSVDSLHDLRSISKSVTSLLLGLALGGDYAEALETPVTEYFKNLDIAFGDRAQTVTLQHVLTMTAGFEWDEWSLPYSDPRNDEHQLNMAEDPVELVLNRRLTDPPGTVWNYSGGLTQLLAAIVELKTGKRLDVFASEALFGPLDITNFEWLGSSIWQPQGRPNAASGLRMRARDLAKVGSLLLHNGIWNNRQIVPQEWIQLSTKRHVMEVPWGRGGTYGYGFQWWPGRSNSIPSYKIIAGFGNGGQQLLVVPEHHLVVTIFAGNYGRNGQALFNWMLNRIVPAHRKHG
jgi:CubicO group peptidase (beta-lactamase class C family)